MLENLLDDRVKFRWIGLVCFSGGGLCMWWFSKKGSRVRQGKEIVADTRVLRCISMGGRTMWVWNVRRSKESCVKVRLGFTA